MFITSASIVCFEFEGQVTIGPEAPDSSPADNTCRSSYA
jgi:hypothetical protein